MTMIPTARRTMPTAMVRTKGESDTGKLLKPPIRGISIAFNPKALEKATAQGFTPHHGETTGSSWGVVPAVVVGGAADPAPLAGHIGVQQRAVVAAAAAAVSSRLRCTCVQQHYSRVSID